MTVGDTVTAALLIGWFALSVTNQFHRGRRIRVLKRYDLFSLIPVWTFFAPRPGREDTRLLYRDQTSEGNWSYWRELAPPHRQTRDAVWNPGKRRRKTLSDLSSNVARAARNGKPDRSILVDLSYLTLLCHVSAQERPADAVARQFLIARTTGHQGSGGPTIIFISGIHRLGERGGTASQMAAAHGAG